MNRLIVAICAIALACFAAPTSVRAGDVGVVLLHGKWGTAKVKSPIGKLRANLEDAGFDVIAPDMPWSRSRYLEKGYEESMAEIDEAVATLKRRGAGKVVVGGHSMGANAALGYGARRAGLAGILAMAPGHIPGDPGYASAFTEGVARAKAMVADGKGDDQASFGDVNQGRAKEIEATAAAYLSWFDPAGPAVMKGNAAKLTAPLFWIVGEEDRMAARGEAYAYAAAPAHPKNAYVVIAGGHKATPIKGAKKVIKWLKSL